MRFLDREAEMARLSRLAEEARGGFAAVWGRRRGDCHCRRLGCSRIVWLTQERMCRLFGRERTVITKHINNVFKEGELERKVVCAKFAHTTPHGAITGKTQVKEVVLYNLNVVISVGYPFRVIRVLHG